MKTYGRLKGEITGELHTQITQCC